MKLNLDDYPLSVARWGRIVNGKRIILLDKLRVEDVLKHNKYSKVTPKVISRAKAKRLIYHLGAKFYSEMGNVPHTYKGSYIRHVVVERLLSKVAYWKERFIGESNNLVRVFQFILDFLFGLNCNYPMREIIEYIISWRASK